MSTYYQAVLNCRHVLEFTMAYLPKRGDQIQCRKCGWENRTVIRVDLEVSVVCQECIFARYYGLGDQNGRRVAQKHAADTRHWLLWTTKDAVTEIHPVVSETLFDVAS